MKLTTENLNKYINLFRNDVILEVSSTAFDDDKCLSAMRTSNYVETTYIPRIEKITEATADGLIGTPYNFNNDTSFKSKLITGYAMSNVLFNHICLNEDYDAFNENFYDPNITYDIRNQCITPYTLSNFAYKHLVAQKEKTTNTANPHDSANETKVIIGGTLSNYVQEQISYKYELMTISNRNKFVRGSNLLKFNDEKLKLNSKGANFRTKYLGLPFGDQSFIIHKHLFNFIGEYTVGLYEGEDHEFVWKAKKIGIKINIIENFIISSNEKYISKPISQTLITLSKTVSQILKFRKQRATSVICHFIKDPKSLKSKTRLRKELTEKFVNDLNEGLMEIVTDNIKEIKSNKSIHQITVSEKIHKDYALEFSKITDGLYLTSQEELGRSMKEVVVFNFKYFQKIVIVGSDIPFLTAKDITDCLKVRSAKNIFYPTLDGGFCLLATSDNKILDVLDKIKYGTDSVLENLTKNISQLFINNKFYQDIDVKEDLPKVYKVLKEKAYSINATRKKLYTLLYSNQKQFSE